MGSFFLDHALLESKTPGFRLEALTTNPASPPAVFKRRGGGKRLCHSTRAQSAESPEREELRRTEHSREQTSRRGTRGSPQIWAVRLARLTLLQLENSFLVGRITSPEDPAL